MKKELVIISVVSAIIGAGLMLFALGGERSSGIEGWTPISEEVAASIENMTTSVSEDTKKALKAEVADSESEVHNKENNSMTTDASDGLIHINSAGLNELQNIPGIGVKKAQAILDYRNQHGAFTSINDLTKVKGIGDKMLQKMKPHIGL
ncbi:ComE operon protein 1 [compost metagenome]